MDQNDTPTQDLDVGAAIEEGLRLCRTEDWQTGMEILWKVARNKNSRQDLPAIYYSFAGFGTAKFEGNIKEGIALCRHAIKLDPTEPDNYLNLARVHMLRYDRRTAVKALHRGLRIRPTHPRLTQFEREIGYRRPAVIPFLSRDNQLNIWFGKRAQNHR